MRLHTLLGLGGLENRPTVAKNVIATTFLKGHIQLTIVLAHRQPA